MSKKKNSYGPIRSIFIFYILILIITTPPLGFTETKIVDSTPPSDVQHLSLSLREAIELTLENNLDIRVERFNPRISEAMIIVEKGAFDPTIALDLSINKDKRPVANAYADPDVSEGEGINWGIGIRQDLITGGNYQLRFTNERRKSNSSYSGLNPQYTSDLTLTLTQPLLKDFGIGLNKRKIIIASNNKDISLNQFKAVVITKISEVQNMYWDIVFNIEDLKVKRQSLALAQDLEKRVRTQVKVGTMAPIEILQAQAEVASREEGVIIAENMVKDSEDRLKRAMNIEGDSPYWGLPIYPTDRPLFEVVEIDNNEALKTSFEKRPDFVQAKIDLSNKKIEVKYKKNQIFPNIDLIGSFGLNGLSGDAREVSFGGTTIPPSRFGGGYEDTLDRLGSGSYYSWEAGVKVNIPLGNRSAKSNLTAARIEEKKVLISLKNLEQKIALEIREAVRGIETNIKRVNATKLARRLAEQKLDAEEKRFEVGLSTSFNILEFQKDLAEEQSKEIKAIIDYNKSLVKLERVKGTTLEKNEIRL